MKRQRLVSVSGFEAAKKKKQPNQKAVAVVLSKNTEEEEQLTKKEGKKMEVTVAVGGEENVSGLDNNWEENRYWIGDFVDEQMSWGSVWFPFWDVDFSGDAFSAFYGDVVLDDDIWNLNQEIPNPFQG